MSMGHHGGYPQQGSNPEMEKLLQRFTDQIEGRAKREYSQGRLNEHDDGVISFAVAADKEHKRIIIDFGKPVAWVGMSASDAITLINTLRQKVNDLGEAVTITV